jgi:hypothetical protein
MWQKITSKERKNNVRKERGEEENKKTGRKKANMQRLVKAT